MDDLQKIRAEVLALRERVSDLSLAASAALAAGQAAMEALHEIAAVVATVGDRALERRVAAILDDANERLVAVNEVLQREEPLRIN